MMRIFPLVILLCGCAKAESKNTLTITTGKALQQDSVTSKTDIQAEPKPIVLIDFVGATEEDSVLLTRIFEGSKIYFELPEEEEASVVVNNLAYLDNNDYQNLNGYCINLNQVRLEIKRLTLGEEHELLAFYNDDKLYQVEFDVTEREGYTNIEYEILKNVSPNACAIVAVKTKDLSNNVGTNYSEYLEWYAFTENELVEILFFTTFKLELRESTSEIRFYKPQDIISYDKFNLEIIPKQKDWAKLRFNHYIFDAEGDILYKTITYSLKDGKYSKD